MCCALFYFLFIITYIYHLPPISISIFPPFYIYYFSVCNSMDADGDRNFCSFCAFRSTFVFVSSGTDCRVRRRMHAPFPGPYVSTFLPLIIRPIVRSLSLSITILNYPYSPISSPFCFTPSFFSSREIMCTLSLFHTIRSHYSSIISSKIVSKRFACEFKNIFSIRCLLY